MNHRPKVSCVLCQRSEETEITGALSTKDEVTAHQNCLLFSSGIYCQNSPEFDDLFGFSVEDVMKEVKRGGKLTCNKCKKKGATAGCEVGRCKKSYHYPCAIQEGAKAIEEPGEGKYELLCFKHYQQQQPRDSDSVNRLKAEISKNHNGAGSSKVYCLACENTEGKISLECLSNGVIMLYCDKHAPSSYKRNANGDSTASGPPVCSSDSNSSSSTTRLSKRRLNFSDTQEETLSKHKNYGQKRRIIDDSSDSDENVPNIECAPLESDFEENANSVPEHQFSRKGSGRPTASTSGNQLEDESRGSNKDEDETFIHSDAESESLLPPVKIGTQFQSSPTRGSERSPQTVLAAHLKVPLVKVVVEGKGIGSKPEQSPVHSPDQHTTGPSAPQQNTTGTPPSPSPDHSKHHSATGSPLCPDLAISPPQPDTICVSLISSSPSPVAPPFDPEPSFDSPSFWKSCNAAGCTQAIFTDFINEMNDISSRIQSDQASQEDYDLALKVMAASGKLAEMVAKQQKELQQKQMELTKAAAAMREVASALRR
ncbi:PHD finger protein 11 isoform X1 [Lates japonicus]|uniref:PHD finger protein 11 isoform X1 n=1 Tax=Lates japonicus TaxID=270547 RepID=A0AAD3MEE5_LATJO|nr:PHD finger protein 11 isoform X1 [Lates japonicus]